MDRNSREKGGQPAWLASLALHGLAGAGAAFEFSVPLEDLDAATIRILQSFVQGVVDFRREELAPARHVRYSLEQEELGPLGSMTLSRLSTNASQLAISRRFWISTQEGIRFRARAGDETAAQLLAAHDRYDLRQADRVQLPPGMTVESYSSLVAEWRGALEAVLKRHWRDVTQGYFGRLSEDGIWRHRRGRVQTQRGPNLRSKERFEVFQGLKAQHPDWTQERVAREARRDLEEEVTAETVRNTYRQMGEAWPRGDRTRQ